MPSLLLAVAAMVRSDKLLVLRKRGAKYFTQAGGKIDAGETPLEALTRELREELGITLDPAEAEYLGVFTAAAANEKGYQIEAHNFFVPWQGEVSIQSEIEAMEWLPIGPEPTLPVAPLIRDTILPLLRQRIH